jgi:uncharacterized protein YcnI
MISNEMKGPHMIVSKKFIAVALAGIAVLVAIPATASAHVVVHPEQVEVAQFQTFTVAVPNEKDVAVTEIRLTVPEGLQSVAPTVKPGWQINTEKSGNAVTEIVWTAGSIPAGQRDDFTFSAQSPAKATELDWKAYQTYEDGTVVSWDQAPSAAGHDDDDDESSDKGPYSQTEVVNDLAAANTAQKDNGNNQTGAYIIAIIALAMSLLALTLKTRRKS